MNRHYFKNGIVFLVVLVCIFWRLGQNSISISQAKLETLNLTRHASQMWICNQAGHVHNEMLKNTHGVVDYVIKTMPRNVRNALFPHNIAQATSGGCIVCQKNISKFGTLPLIFCSKVRVNFFLDTQAGTLSCCHYYVIK